ncbi:MAG: glycosyltransferase family 4 protein [Chloroflexi bacterium]|nr:glycosyltransferase family 4 protein [Chloroflexota bacterium]MCI0578751.1 glycosyltransferase family 4 protein [Chloroflexota bacterium]MCI0643964.1 glycosyltransferase family 4 protein [Chloroflexota bacterium]MCI0729570.1 glycosyltransferase family 4 protein [Chloroflexota bacterium]
MHLALNAYFWNRPNSGSGQYTRQLVYHLNRLVADLEITLVYPQAPGDPGPEEVPPSVRVKIVPLRPGHLGKVLFEQITFPRACREIEATVAHVPYWGAPLQSPVPLVVTIHDLTTLLVREYRRGLRARLYTALVTAGAREARHVLTDSRASQADIVQHLGLPAGKVTPIYLAAGSTYRPQSDLLLDIAIWKKYDLPDSYVLYLGGYEIHKNVTTLLLAYSYVAQALGDEYPLVLAGRRPERPSAHFPDYDDYIARLGLEEVVRWAGTIEEADKPAVYRGASSFAFVSRHEGFGLPPLEAMACGVPVVTSNCSSLPEVVGEAGFALAPDDERQIAGSIIATLIQEELAAEMKQKGLAQAAKFSWEKTATETLLVYDGLV